MADGRAKNGGARRGAGRKRKDVENDLNALLDAAITPGDWQQMFEVLSDNARAANINAARLLMSYKFGMPLQRQELSGPDGSDVPIGYRMMTTAAKPDKPDGE